MKMYVLVKVFGLVVEGVELFITRPEAEAAFKKYTEMTEDELKAQAEGETDFKESHDQTQITEVDAPWISRSPSEIEAKLAELYRARSMQALMKDEKESFMDGLTAMAEWMLGKREQL